MLSKGLSKVDVQTCELVSRHLDDKVIPATESSITWSEATCRTAHFTQTRPAMAPRNESRLQDILLNDAGSSR